jgi:putative phosphoribosyl transferase
MTEQSGAQENEKIHANSGDGGRLIRIGAERVGMQDELYVNGIVNVPQGAHGLVILGHGIERDGDQNISAKMRQQGVLLTDVLNKHGLATLQVDLFSSDEQKLDEETGFFRENIDLMQQRLIGTAEWFLNDSETDNLSIGYLGFGVAGVAALVAAVERPDIPAAVVAVGARPDLAPTYIPRILAPTLLIVAEKDEATARANQDALEQLKAEKQLTPITGVSNVFESQDSVTQLAQGLVDWFGRWLVTIATGE